MIRFLWSFAVNLVCAIVGLLLAKALLADFNVQASGFLLAALVLTIAQAVLAPFVFNMARQYASALLGGIGIVLHDARPVDRIALPRGDHGRQLRHLDPGRPDRVDS